jgi:hypothetical protein
MQMATSTGPKKANLTQPEMQGPRPKDSMLSTAKQPQKLPLPAGPQKDSGNMPEGRLA